MGAAPARGQYLDCYAVFSGGDDLFIVGPCGQILDLTLAFRQDFHRWTARDDLIISAGQRLVE